MLTLTGSTKALKLLPFYLTELHISHTLTNIYIISNRIITFKQYYYQYNIDRIFIFIMKRICAN